MYTEEINKIALSSNDNKRLQTFDRVTTYPYGANAFRVRESEMVKVFEVNEKWTDKSMQSENEIGIMSNKCESEMYVKEKYKREM